MIPALIAAGVAVGGAIASGVQKSRAQKQQQEAFDKYFQQQTGLARKYENEYNKNFFDTAFGKSAINQMNKRYDSQAAGIDANSAFSGATHEQKLASRRALNSSYDDQVKNLAQIGAQHKMNQFNSLQNMWGQLNNAQYQQGVLLSENTKDKSQQAGNASGNALGALSSLLDGLK